MHQKCLKGDEYVSSSGSVVRAKMPQPVNCERCRFKCGSRIDEDTRQEIRTAYYMLANYERQKDFLVSNVVELQPKVMVLESAKHHTTSRSYYLPTNVGKVRVCQKFFCATLELKPRSVRKYLEVRAQNHVVVAGLADRRGRHEPSSKTSAWKCDLIRKHIAKYPSVESHYCRSNSTCQYLDAGLGISKMYDHFKEFWQTEVNESGSQTGIESRQSRWHQMEVEELYGSESSEYVPRNMLAPPSEKIYRHIFCTEFNLRFFKPKKDQCSECVSYASSTLAEKQAQSSSHEQKL